VLPRPNVPLGPRLLRSALPRPVLLKSAVPGPRRRCSAGRTLPRYRPV